MDTKPCQRYPNPFHTTLIQKIKSNKPSKHWDIAKRHLVIVNLVLIQFIHGNNAPNDSTYIVKRSVPKLKRSVYLSAQRLARRTCEFDLRPGRFLWFFIENVRCTLATFPPGTTVGGGQLMLQMGHQSTNWMVLLVLMVAIAELTSLGTGSQQASVISPTDSL